MVFWSNFGCRCFFLSSRHWNDALVPSWTWHMLMISSQWRWCSSQHANHWLEPAWSRFPRTQDQNGLLHKQAVQVYMFVWKMNRITFEPVSGTLERLAQEAQALDSRYVFCSSGQVACPSRVGCDGGLCSSGETCADSFEIKIVITYTSRPVSWRLSLF